MKNNIQIEPLTVKLVASLVMIAGCFNSVHAATGDAVLINEVVGSTTSTDVEYIELYGNPGASLEGLSVIVVESDAGSSNGSIDKRYDFSSEDMLGSNGYLLLGNSLVESTYAVTPDLVITNNFVENSSYTLALVETASLSGSSVTGAESVLDAIGVSDGGASDHFFFDAPVIGPDGSYLPAGGYRLVEGIDTDSPTDWGYSSFYNSVDSNTPTAAAGDAPPPPAEIYAIHQIQGDARSSPMLGATVTVEAIVVGDFQNNNAADNGDLRGFYLQEEDADTDTDEATSEGIFVYDGSGTLDVAVGDKVQVTGTVKEYYQLTEIDADSVVVLASGETLPTPASIHLPVSSVDDFEAYEGMLTTFPQALMISEYYNFDRYGEIVLAQPLSGEPRPMTPTTVEEPGSAPYLARLDANMRSRITLDDGRTSQNPDPAYHPNGSIFDLNNRFRGGDLVQDAIGVLDYRYSKFRLQPTAGATYIPNNPRPNVPYLDSDLKVASFNVLNYFTTLDDGNNDLCGPNENLECRGADNIEEFERQRAKIIQALYELDADIVGLIEIENNDRAAVQDLVNGMNALAGADTYQMINTGTIGDDAIKVAFIYKPARVTALGDYAILNQSVDERFIDDKNRPALAQTFMSKTTAGRFTVAVNHLKSKGSNCDSLGDPDLNDGQGNCNLTRTGAAMALADWMASNPTGAGNSNNLIIGDLNAYDKEDPIKVITDAGFIDLVGRDQGEYAYTYVFNGQYGYLDHALASTDLATGSEAAVWHINADEPDILDYDTSYKQDAQDALYEADAFRSSDHDPVLIGLDVKGSLADILAFARQSQSEGTLQGIGKRPATRLRAFLHILKQASHLEQRGKQHAACKIAGVAKRFSDGRRRPRDLVKGDAVAFIPGMLSHYRAENCRR